MEKKRINKLVVPLTLRSASLLGAFTIMTTSIGGCTPKNKKNNTSDTSSIISSTSEDENASDLDVVSSNESTINEDKVNENIPSSEITNNSQNITPNNNQSNTNSKPNQTKPSTNNSPSQTTPNTNNNQNSSITDFIPLTKDNINNVEIFEKAVYEVSKETRGWKILVWEYYYDDELYKKTDIPKEEFTYLLASLNQEYLTEETLKNLLNYYSEKDLKRFCNILGNVAGLVERANCTNKWDGLLLNVNIKNQFIAIEQGILEYTNNNPKLLKELLNNYDYDNNPLVGLYLAEACNVAYNNSSLKDEELIDKYIDLLFDIKPKCEQEATNMYNKIHGKTKVLE